MLSYPVRARHSAAVLLLLVSGLTLPAQSAPPTQERLEALTAHELPRAFALYRQLLSLPNDAHNAADILRLSEFLEGEFRSRGFTTSRLEMPGSDAILAERRVPGAERTVLVYLQADGQPVDSSRWHQESPWTPTLTARRAGATSVDGNPTDWTSLPWDRLGGPDPEWRIFARSASDSKGPVAQFLSAISALDAGGLRPDYNLKVIVDTEEEMGSPHLPAMVAQYRERLAADLLVIFDGPPHVTGEPTLTFGARGIARFTLTVYGPRVAQHSGHWGNYVPNPALRLAQLLASMKNDEGRVTIPGFYDGVSIDAATQRILDAVPDDTAALHREIGIAAPDRGVASSAQAALQYPSLNLRGLRAAWVGDEARTIIPPDAVAEVDVRLVKETDPARLLELIRTHITAQGYHVISGRAPTDEERARYPRIARFDGSSSYLAFRTEFDSEPGRWLRRAMVRRFGREPVMLRTAGGSIPISPFVTTLGVPAVSVGTVNPDNNQHSPNENLRVGDFVRGIATILSVLTEPLGAPPGR
jgi:acetylornithine deacetylase/succinyl-diaminopimelate desuccinylase-like protein